jgi:S-adenosyl-L-methionine hydrolase (adenosine-forming)
MKINPPICALITDFGNRDYFIGVMKGVMRKIAPAVEFIDLTNEIPSYNLLPACFAIEKSYRYFPDHTIFLVVVDPGVGTERKILLVEHGKHYFIGPDNGVLTPILNKKEKSVFALDKKKYFLIEGYSTFEARDKMSPAAAYLAAGIEPRKLASPVSSYVTRDDYVPKVVENTIDAQIVYIDKFGNLMTNITREILLDAQESSGKSRFKAEIGDSVITDYCETYGHAPVGGDPFMVLGSHLNLEIAVNQRSAALLLDAVYGLPVKVTFY